MRLTRQNAMGFTYYIDSICGQPNKCEVTLAQTGKKLTLECSQEELSQRWYRWQILGHFIQDAFSNLKPAEREFILTGITPEEWDQIFPPEEIGKEDKIDKQYQQYLKDFPKHDPRD